MSTNGSVRKQKACAECGKSLKGSVALFIPGIVRSGSSNLCVDCVEKHFENHLSEERRSGRNSPSFRGLVQFARTHTTARPKSRPRRVTTENIAAALKSGSLTVEELLSAIKEGTK